ncbi:MAG: hypothetical protein P9X24_06540 [Candidatus Hatepunaea meridiana]|nr:hypothetical protein [Candidatus Hatepunaea meridiana]
MFKRLCLLIVLLICITTAGAAPTFKSDQSGFKDWLGGSGKPSFGLLDPSRLTVQHNLSFGVTSGNGSSLMQSLYMTKLGYKLSDPLTLTLLLGVQNNRYSGNLAIPNDFSSPVGGFAIDYRPRKNIYFRLEMVQAPGLQLPVSRRYNEMTAPTIEK